LSFFVFCFAFSVISLMFAQLVAGVLVMKQQFVEMKPLFSQLTTSRICFLKKCY